MRIEIIEDRLVPYRKAMQWFDDVGRGNRDDEKIIIFEHQDVYTCGKSINNNTLKQINGTEAISTQRGGLWTWHGRGQVMIYFTLNLRKRKITLTDWFALTEPLIVKSIEEEITKLTNLSKAELRKILQIYADKNKRGFWVKNLKNQSIAKIGFIGLRITNGFLTHGISINYNNDLSVFDYINPCGLGNVKITSISEVVKNIRIEYQQKDIPRQSQANNVNDFKTLLANNMNNVFK